MKIDEARFECIRCHQKKKWWETYESWIGLLCDACLTELLEKHLPPDEVA